MSDKNHHHHPVVTDTIRPDNTDMTVLITF